MTGPVLELIDESLESFFRATVPLSATDVDVSFEAPDRDWSAKLTRPTVNLFLWDIRRSSERSNAGVRTVVQDGQTLRQAAFPVVELRYVVTAWTSDLEDERALLAGLLRTLLAHGQVPREFLAGELSTIDMPTLKMARAGEDHMDVFKALEGKVKPGLNMVLSSEFDTGVFMPVGPPVEVIETAVGRIGGADSERRRRVAGEVANAADRGAIGALVRSPIDATHVDPSGRFLLRAREGDEIIIDVEPSLVTTVPESGGVRLG